MKTYWNGLRCHARRGKIRVGKSPKPSWWCASLEGQIIDAVEVEYEGQRFYLADRDGSGWAKVTEGRGSPQWPHSSIPVDEGTEFEESVTFTRKQLPAPGVEAKRAPGTKIRPKYFKGPAPFGKVRRAITKDDSMPLDGFGWNPLLKYPRNEPCFCKSEIKAKKCCLPKLPRALPIKQCVDLENRWQEIIEHKTRVNIVFDDDKHNETFHKSTPSFTSKEQLKDQKEAEEAIT